MRLRTAELLTPVQVDSSWQLVTADDFNRDGQPDLVFQHTDGGIAIWLMNGRTLAQPILTSPSGPSDSNWKVIGAADLNRDCSPDLIFQNRATADLAAWLMDGITLSSGSLLHPANPGDPNWKLAAVADYSGDDHPDLIFQNGDKMGIWFMNGLNLILGQELSPLIGDLGWRVMGPK